MIVKRHPKNTVTGETLRALLVFLVFPKILYFLICKYLIIYDILG